MKLSSGAGREQHTPSAVKMPVCHIRGRTGLGSHPPCCGLLPSDKLKSPELLGKPHYQGHVNELLGLLLCGAQKNYKDVIIRGSSPFMDIIPCKRSERMQML